MIFYRRAYIVLSLLGLCIFMSCDISDTQIDVQTSDQGGSQNNAGITSSDEVPAEELPWCRMLASSHSTIVLDSDEMTTYSSTCVWEGYTQICRHSHNEQAITAHVYHPKGVVLRSEIKTRTSYHETHNTYDCSGPWCKFLSSHEAYTQEGVTRIINKICSWEDHVQTCVDSQNEDVVIRSTYHPKGAVLLKEVESGDELRITEFAYDCSGAWCKYLGVSSITVNGVTSAVQLGCYWEGYTQKCSFEGDPITTVYHESGVILSREERIGNAADLYEYTYDCEPIE